MKLSHVAGLACLVCLALFVISGPSFQKDSDPPLDDVAAQTTPPVVIIMIGDGMGDGLLEAASYYRTGAPGQLALQNLPHQGRMVTVGIDGVTDSAAAATAMATGEFTINKRVGIDPAGDRLENLVELSRTVGMTAGIVTTALVPHATPAAFTAHSDSRLSEVEIAEQQFAANLQVMLGGGLAYFMPRGRLSEREDGGLLEPMEAAGYRVVTSRRGLNRALNERAEKILGLFALEHIPYVLSNAVTPPLAEMSMAAIRTLERHPGGFFLMIEGARIDMAAHSNRIDQAIAEVLAFDDAVLAVTRWAKGRDNVLLLVTADHDTGGVQLHSTPEAGTYPDVTWTSTHHTNQRVMISGLGRGSEQFAGRLLDHRWVHAVARARILGEPLQPPPAVLPDATLMAGVETRMPIASP